MDLVGKGKRRLACEQAIARRGYKTFKECTEACERHARKLNSQTSWSNLAVQHYVTCYADFSMRRVKVLADLLGFSDIKEMDEKFTPPKMRGIGDNWVGDEGSIAKDYDLLTK